MKNIFMSLLKLFTIVTAFFEQQEIMKDSNRLLRMPEDAQGCPRMPKDAQGCPRIVDF